MISKRRSSSARPSEDVGSSRIRTLGRSAQARAISIIWRCPVESALAGARASRSIPRRSSIAWASATIVLRPSHRPPARTGSRPTIRFSAIERLGSTVSSWNTVWIPAAFASAGLSKLMARPSSRIWPVSGGNRPEAIFMRVDLPAPFSPMNAWTSPATRSNRAPSSASTPGNRLEMSSSSSSKGRGLSDVEPGQGHQPPPRLFGEEGRISFPTEG